MYNAGLCCMPPKGDHKLPLESFAKRRDDVVAEVLRARERHYDNIVTSLEETLRQVAMVATVAGSIRVRAVRRVALANAIGAMAKASPAGLLWWLLGAGMLEGPTAAAPTIFVALMLYVLLYLAITAFLVDHLRQFRRLQLASLDDTFEDAYADFFIHNDGEDHRARWQVVRPKLFMMLSSIPCPSQLPPFPKWEVRRIDEVLKHDIWHLRQLARLIRMQQKRPNATVSATGAAAYSGRSSTSSYK